MDIDLATDPIAQDKDGKDVYLKDIWPTQAEIANWSRNRDPRGVPSRNTPTSSRATRNGRASR
jgi:aconitase A